MGLNNAVDNDDEGAGRSADLKPRTAKSGNKKARDNGGDQTFVRRRAGGDGDRHSERQRDDGHRQARQRIGAEIGEAISLLGDHRDRFGNEDAPVGLGARGADGLLGGHFALTQADGQACPWRAQRSRPPASDA